MKRTIMKYSIMFSLFLLTSCDISDKEIEQKSTKLYKIGAWYFCETRSN